MFIAAHATEVINCLAVHPSGEISEFSLEDCGHKVVRLTSGLLVIAADGVDILELLKAVILQLAGPPEAA
jgi:hypothetical protein